MNASSFKISTAALLPSVATMLFVQACGGSSDAVAQAERDAIEGVWEAVVTQRDCTSNAAIATFRGMQVLHRGGSLTDTQGANPGARSPGFGQWSRNADATYAVKFRFYRFNADGSPAGSNLVSSTRTLGADGNSYSGTTRNEVRDTAGTLVATLCITDAGTRVF